MESTSCSASTAENEKAWYLLTLLIRLGRPSSPEELATRCSLFDTSPEHVIYLCFIPDSPLRLTIDLFVTISRAAFSELGEFVRKGTHFVPRTTFRIPENYGRKRIWNEIVWTYSRKRKGLKACPILLPPAKRRLLLLSETVGAEMTDKKKGEPSQFCLGFSAGDGIEAVSSKVYIGAADIMSEDAHSAPINTLVVQDTSETSEQEGTSPLLIDCNAVLSSHRVEITNHKMVSIDNETKSNLKEIRAKEPSESVQLPICQHNSTFNSAMEPDLNVEMLGTWEEAQRDISYLQTAAHIENYQTGSKNRECYSVNSAEAQVNETQNASFCLRTEKPCHVSSQSEAILVIAIPDTQACVPRRCKKSEDTRTTVDFHCREGHDPYDNTEVSEKAAQTGQLLKHDLVLTNQMHSDNTKASLLIDHKIALKMDIPAEAPIPKSSSTQQQPSKFIDDQNAMQRDTFSSRRQIHSKPSPDNNLGDQNAMQRDTCSSRRQIHSKPSPDNNLEDPSKQLEHFKGERKRVPGKQKPKRSRNNNVPDKVESTRKAPKMLPNFESFIIEEEEGSGGYGTVYRARRKHDDKTVAVKCPHANAHVHHVNNELKMLERFGGRNFIIKYEGSFRNGNSECFVLEHVEHDRPEVLKREIDIYELQWYGYCMFRALASLHKQGIVHRDVKPGNFLFSRKSNKGYLIDFNLAQDLHQKYLTNSKSTMNSDGYLDHSPLPFSGIKDFPSKQVKQVMNGRLLESLSSFKEAARDSRLSHETKNVNRRAGATQLKNSVDLSSRNRHRNPAGDASGITPTSTRTPSVDKLKEPMPCQGRKELINLVQEAMQGPVHEAVNVPVSQRKRVAAPLGKVDKKLVFPTPMPLHSHGTVIYGAGHLKTRGDGKPKREGPCVGTKGFRAPEVLFKSPHQGPKVDIWSAGVTLLYFMIGRSPFVGDPEQNIKDIGQLRGSEDLWEVAKIHNRESSFPVDLFDIQSLPPMELREWCQINTRRLGFLDRITEPLFDLVDKCLTVNPRLRINAEEALRHEFFSPCHEALSRQRILRQALGSELGSSPLRSSSS